MLYLCGPIDATDDGGKAWRAEWTKKLIDVGFKAPQILDPCNKPIKNAPFDLNDEQKLMKEYRRTRNWDGLTDIVSQIVHIDLRLVEKSDLILANFPVGKNGYQINTYGTMHEIVNARKQRKPVYVVWEGGKEKCSGWLMWLVGHKNVFGTFNELLGQLKNISSGKTEYNAKDWLLLNFDKE